MLKKVIILMICFLLLSINVCSYVVPEYYKGTQIKFYGNTINKEMFYYRLRYMPDKYLNETKAILVFNHMHYSRCQGMAAVFQWDPQIIKICFIDEDTIVHELAHLKNKLDGYTLWESSKVFGEIIHPDIFYEAEETIWKEIFATI